MGFLTDSEIQQTIKKASDPSNCIDFANFLVVMTKHFKGEAPIEEIQEAFRVFDKNNNGHINAEEFKKVIISGTQFTSEDVRYFFVYIIHCSIDGRDTQRSWS